MPNIIFQISVITQAKREHFLVGSRILLEKKILFLGNTKRILMKTGKNSGTSEYLHPARGSAKEIYCNRLKEHEIFSGSTRSRTNSLISEEA